MLCLVWVTGYIFGVVHWSHTVIPPPPSSEPVSRTLLFFVPPPVPPLLLTHYSGGTEVMPRLHSSVARRRKCGLVDVDDRSLQQTLKATDVEDQTLRTNQVKCRDWLCKRT